MSTPKLLTMPDNVREAISRAQKQKLEKGHAWNSVFVDVFCYGEKVGHIVSDGYQHTRWDFYPTSPSRQKRAHYHFENAIPQWAHEALTLGEPVTSSDMSERADEKKRLTGCELRREALTKYRHLIVHEDRDALAVAACRVLIDEPDEFQTAIDLARLALGRKIDKEAMPV